MRRKLLPLCCALLLLLGGCARESREALAPEDIWELGYGKIEEEFFAVLSLDPEQDAKEIEMPGVKPGRAAYELHVPMEFNGEPVQACRVSFWDYKMTFANFRIDLSDSAGKDLRAAYDFMESGCLLLEEEYGPSIYRERYGGDNDWWWGIEWRSFENLEASLKRETFSGMADLYPLPGECYVTIGLSISPEYPEYRDVGLSFQPYEENLPHRKISP